MYYLGHDVYYLDPEAHYLEHEALFSEHEAHYSVQEAPLFVLEHKGLLTTVEHEAIYLLHLYILSHGFCVKLEYHTA